MREYTAQDNPFIANLASDGGGGAAASTTIAAQLFSGSGTGNSAVMTRISPDYATPTVYGHGGTATLSLINGAVLQVAAPASSSATCIAGQYAVDATYHYDCVAANSWKRAVLSTFSP